MSTKKPLIPHNLYVDLKAAKELQCAICLDIMDHATEVGCNEGHIFCQTCVDTLKESTRSTRITHCPLCRGQCNESRIHHVKHIDRQINSLKVKCKNHRIGGRKRSIIQKKRLNYLRCFKKEADENDNKEALPLILRRSARIKKNTENKVGCKRKFRDNECEEITSGEIAAKRRKLNEYKETCKWIGSRSEYYDHVKICPLQLSKCHYCFKPMLRKERKLHYKTCGSFPIECEKCDCDGIPRNKMSIHVENFCAMTLISCSKCKQNVRRYMLGFGGRPGRHEREDCTETVILCEYNNVGCEFQYKRKDMDKHIAEFVHLHLKKVNVKVNNMDIRLNNLEQKMNTILSFNNHNNISNVNQDDDQVIIILD
eukprot:473707_1